jgi:TM2 domain-containing membrane protein YozV
MKILMAALILTGMVTFSSFGGEGDSAVVLKPKVAHYDFDAIPKDPLASAFFSATLPGSGQFYNKEYGRGIITGVGFYGCFYLAQYLLARFDAYNQDTVYFKETDINGIPTGYYRNVYVPKPSYQQKWPSATEKYLAIGSIVSCGAFYVWGIYDSYHGAKRYNQKLVAEADRKFVVKLALAPHNDGIGLNAKYRF